MKYILIITVLLFSKCLYSQEYQETKSTNNVDSIVLLLNQEIKLNNSNKEELEKLNSELVNQLVIYKAKEDYFAVALADQSNRFSLIVAILIAFLGLFSFSWYRLEHRRTNKKLKAFTQEFENIKKENEKMNINLCRTAGNSYTLISIRFRAQENYIESFQSTLRAVREHSKSVKFKKKKEYKTIISNLKLAIEDFTEIKKKPELKNKLLVKINSINNDIDLIQNVNNEEIKYLCAEIRITIKNYLK
jgi:hypothetical protein